VYFTRQRRSPMDFTVRHFAGDVTYNAKVRRRLLCDSAVALVCVDNNLGHVSLRAAPPCTTPINRNSRVASAVHAIFPIKLSNFPIQSLLIAIFF
jgi:hypothetical protein